MKWFEISEKRPPYGKLIWVWDNEKSYKFLITYLGSEETWFNSKESRDFPIWANLNDEDSSYLENAKIAVSMQN